MSDLIIDVRQVSSYPNLPASNGTETILVQQSGLGGPYASISSAALVSTALNQAGPALGVGVTPASGAAANQIFTGSHSIGLGGGVIFNAYSTATGILNWGPGFSGSWELHPEGFFVWSLGSGATGQPSVWSDVMQLSMAGDLSLSHGTLSVARDPASPDEVATMGWVGKSTVASFNNRNGQVILNAADVYNALQLCDPIATQPWVNQAITNSIQNLLVTCPFVNRWNNRTGSVYLMLSDITTVFYQPGQQPISPTPLPTSNDDSIATTKWVSQHPPALTASAPPLNPTSGQLWWDSTDGNLYVYYQDPTSAQWVSAMAAVAAAGVGIFLPLSGGALSGPLTVNAQLQADDLTITGGSLAFPGNLPGDYVDDGAAEAGGVVVGGVYRNGSVLMVRAI